MNKGKINVDFKPLSITTGTTTWLEVGEQIAEKISTALDIECECFVKNIMGYDSVVITLPLFAEQSDMSSTIVPCLVMDDIGVISSSGGNSSTNMYMGLYREDGFGYRFGFQSGSKVISGSPQAELNGLVIDYNGNIYIGPNLNTAITGLTFDLSFLDSNGVIGVMACDSSSQAVKFFCRTFFIKAKNKLTNTYHPTIFRTGDGGGFGNSFVSYVIVVPTFYGLDLVENEYKGVEFRFSDVVSDGLVLRKIQNQIYETEDMFMLASTENTSLHNYAQVGNYDDIFKDGIIMPDGTHYYVLRNARSDTRIGIALLAIRKFD